MDKKERMLDLKARMEKNLTENILPFWANFTVDDEKGGFYGRVFADHSPDKGYAKAVVLNTRILWTFSMAYEVFDDEAYAKLAHRAFDYISRYFWDDVFGGAYWMLNSDGVPTEVEKRTYGQAFIVYAMAEYYRAFKNEKALEMAMETFKRVQDHVAVGNGGYYDSVARDWEFDQGLILWRMNSGGAPKLLNSHLHMFEATMTLYDATRDEYVRTVLKEFLEFLIDVCVEPETHHLKAGMDRDGNRMDHEINYGHDSECCYLMTWSARLIGDEDLRKRADAAALDIMDHVLEEAIDPVNGGMFHEINTGTGVQDRSKIWWAQAEGITSFFNCYQITGDEKYLDAAINIWDYTEENVVDPTGEWYSVGKNKVMDYAWRVREAARAGAGSREKANKSKCPYHNARTCFEIMKRVDEEINKMA
ncbi:MAG: AGE family epimerase/isomerase [Oscillospiraceae bacterium]|nr:AGE family epimerase/isomerase [Oscillospiraceae bacterium]